MDTYNIFITDDEVELEDSSDLTLGGIVCGNPSKALRMRSRARQETLKEEEHKEKLPAEVSVRLLLIEVIQVKAVILN